MKVSVRKPSKQELDKMNIKNWGTWGCEVSMFDWEYTDQETCYLFEGQVTVKTPDGDVSFGAGDVVVFPQGLKCTWVVTKPVRKAYKFGA